MGVISVELCRACWLKVAPLIPRAALDERAHLEMIARKLKRCHTCSRHCPAIREVAQRGALGGVLDWIDAVAERL